MHMLYFVLKVLDYILKAFLLYEACLDKSHIIVNEIPGKDKLRAALPNTSFPPLPRKDIDDL